MKKINKHENSNFSFSCCFICGSNCSRGGCTPSGDNDGIVLKSPDSIMADAGVSSFEITFSANSVWNASVLYEDASEKWISLDQSEGGAGDNVMTVNVSANNGEESRTAVVNISGNEGNATVTVVQGTADSGDPGKPDEPVDQSKNLIRRITVDVNGEYINMVDFEYSSASSIYPELPVRMTASSSSGYEDGINSYSVEYAPESVTLKVSIDGETETAVANIKDGKVTSLEQDGNTFATMSYDGDRLVESTGSGWSTEYVWDSGNMVSSAVAFDWGVSYNYAYSYSGYDNNANLDLNWLFVYYDGGSDGITPLLGLLGLLGERSGRYAVPDPSLYAEDESIPDSRPEAVYDGQVDVNYYTLNSQGTEAKYEFGFADKEKALITSARSEVPVYIVKYKRTKRYIILDYDDYYTAEDGTRYYYQYDMEETSEEVSREQTGEYYVRYEIGY